MLFSLKSKMLAVLVLLINIVERNKITGNSIGNDFKVLKNQDIYLDRFNRLISNVNKLTEAFCLSSCNSNSKCITSVFNTEISLINNCFLYNNYFHSDELIQSNSSIFFKKKKTVTKSNLYFF